MWRHMQDNPSHPLAFLATGQILCHNAEGREIPCPGSGQDAAFVDLPTFARQRFLPCGEGLVTDSATGLIWPTDAGAVGFPLPWAEALVRVDTLARTGWLGRADWRLPNRRELRSLISYGAARPALPSGHPFVNVFLGWYWSSTTAALAPGYAWYVHLEGGRMFYGKKDQDCLCWPVAGASRLPRTGQYRCYDAGGAEISCPGTGQDGALLAGTPWPQPRFSLHEDTVRDRLTGLVWARHGIWRTRELRMGEGLPGCQGAGVRPLATRSVKSRQPAALK